MQEISPEYRSPYFNSRPSARGDGPGLIWKPFGSRISIHAPPRGATAFAQ